MDNEAILIVPYYFWQFGKLREIQRRYSKVYSTKDRNYLVNYLQVDCQCTSNNVLFPTLHRMAKGGLIPEEMLQKEVPPSIVQTINSFYGTLNQQSAGSIVSYNTTYASPAELGELIARIKPALDYIQGISPDTIDNIKDDLDSISEQIISTAPRKNRLQKALAGIKKFASDCGTKLAVNLATETITGLDWANLINKIEQFISTLN